MKQMICGLLLAFSMWAGAANMDYQLLLKQPGMDAKTYHLTNKEGRLIGDGLGSILSIESRQQPLGGNGLTLLEVRVTALERIHFNLGVKLPTGVSTDDADFYLPGFWYHKNLRSPATAPSFHTSKNWQLREDRLSSPLTGVIDLKTGRTFSVLRIPEKNGVDALCTHQEGEVILSGPTSVGYVGFDNDGGKAALTFGYPYVEAPTRYIRKKTLTPAITAFARLEKGQSKTLQWVVRQADAKDFGAFVSQTWEHCMEQLDPQPIHAAYTPEQMKAQLANYYRESYVDSFPLKYYSGHGLRITTCTPGYHVQLGFCGRVLLNAFNALEYGEKTGEQRLINSARDIIESWKQYGFTAKGYFKENMFIDKGIPEDMECIHTIRQQSEAVYAMFHYLTYERKQGRKHKDWEQRLRHLLDQMLLLQKEDGHFPRKFRDDHSEIDASGGSTPSATSTLVMGYKYFKDKRYLEAARRTVDYLEKNIIVPSDYFSSTLDANCEDKEAAISAVTATYYMAMVTKNAERKHYTDLCRQASYFALSWYYLWDVPFAQGQRLGDLDFRSRGWGNVSVENNHIDVFVFELPHIVDWLANETGNQRLKQVHDVIFTSLGQLLPTKERPCGIAVPGFYPEVVQHTCWDYGRNGKGFYNNIFAPAWAVASLWELYSPERTVEFLTRK